MHGSSPSAHSNEESSSQSLQTPYIGSRLSLISNSDIRYEGILYSVNTKNATIALAKVRSFGTEDRTTGESVAAVSEVFEFIIFKATDIKDLIVCETASQMSTLNDPAIVSMSQPDKTSSPDFMSSGHSNRSSHLREEVASNQGASLWSKAAQPHHPLVHTSPSFHYNNNNRNYGNGEVRPSMSMPVNVNASSRPLFPPMQRNNGPRPSPGNGRGNQFRQKQQNNAKFETDYDFEQANQQFKRTLDKLTDGVKSAKLETDEETSEGPAEVAHVQPSKSSKECAIMAALTTTTYDKHRSFFDSISCEAIESANAQHRPVRRDRKVNTETFGQSAMRRIPGRMQAGREFVPRGGGGGPDHMMPLPPPHVMWQYMQAMQRQQHQHHAMYNHMPPYPMPYAPRSRFNNNNNNNAPYNNYQMATR